MSGRLYLETPQYLRDHLYQSPNNPREGIFQYTFDESKDKSVFEYYADDAKASHTFNEWLAAYTDDQVPWTDVYPVENLMHGYNQGWLIVDVGGNVGRDLDLFRALYPTYGRHLVLQDLPAVIAQATCADDIQRMEHDFFTAQPTIGARAYCLHSILHDWSDEYARRILTHIRDAMKPNYSKLLVNDIVLTCRQPSSKTASIDIHMMVKLAARERTMKGFLALVEQVGGLNLVGTWEHPDSVTTILELERISL